MHSLQDSLLEPERADSRQKPHALYARSYVWEQSVLAPSLKSHAVRRSNPAHAELLIRYISKDKHISKTGLSR